MQVTDMATTEPFDTFARLAITVRVDLNGGGYFVLCM